MKLLIDINIKSPDTLIKYADSIFVVGSCFTEHIGGRLQQAKFGVMQNPNGILFDPLSVCNSLLSYIQPRVYEAADLFFLNELWQSWRHHSAFSGLKVEEVLERINASQAAAHHALKQANWLIITLGSSFSYHLNETGEPVANCHRAPAQWFDKRLLTIEQTVTTLDNCLHQLFYFNNKLKVIFTVSPVRHIRDGVIENNRSKARLIEAVHHLVNKFERLYYFPAYELVIDVLRDYRFYDLDLVHPNYAATEFVFEQFSSYYIEEETQAAMGELKKIAAAYKHKPFQPDSVAHRQFLEANFKKLEQFKQKYPHVDVDQELRYFASAGKSNAH